MLATARGILRAHAYVMPSTRTKWFFCMVSADAEAKLPLFGGGFSFSASLLQRLLRSLESAQTPAGPGFQSI